MLAAKQLFKLMVCIQNTSGNKHVILLVSLGTLAFNPPETGPVT